MTRQAACFALWIMTGMTPREAYFSKLNIEIHYDFYRVRQQIRDGHPDFPVTGDGWPSFLYPHAKGDINDIENGLLKSALLVKV